MSVEDVTGQLRAAVVGLQRALVALGRARIEVERAGQYTAAATRASNDPKARQAQAAYQSAAGKAIEICALVAAGADAVGGYIAHIEGATSGQAGSTAGSAAPQSVVDHDTPSLASPPSPEHRDVPEHVRDAARRLRSRTADDQMWAKGKMPEWTDGLATNDDDGHAVLGGGTITSGGRGPNSDMPGLKKYPAFRWGNNADHVESHTAALMRADTSLRNVTLTINNEVCNPGQPLRNGRTGEVQKGRDGSVKYKQFTCDEQLPAMLPDGARLTVYVKYGPDGEARFWKTYTGTGEGIAQP